MSQAPTSLLQRRSPFGLSTSRCAQAIADFGLGMLGIWGKTSSQPVACGLVEVNQLLTCRCGWTCGPPHVSKGEHCL